MNMMVGRKALDPPEMPAGDDVAAPVIIVILVVHNSPDECVDRDQRRRRPAKMIFCRLQKRERSRRISTDLMHDRGRGKAEEEDAPVFRLPISTLLFFYFDCTLGPRHVTTFFI
jgi:hypothetical protein